VRLKTLYNHIELTVDSTREIGIGQVEGRRARLWRWVLTVVVLLSLVVALATRFQVTVQDTITVQSIASRAMRQHMNQDAVRWVVPILQLTVLQAPTFHPHVVPTGPSLPSLSVEENLYNRPPPAC
jgi:hypothetical protein